MAQHDAGRASAGIGRRGRWGGTRRETSAYIKTDLVGRCCCSRLPRSSPARASPPARRRHVTWPPTSHNGPVPISPAAVVATFRCEASCSAWRQHAPPAFLHPTWRPRSFRPDIADNYVEAANRAWEGEAGAEKEDETKRMTQHLDEQSQQSFSCILLLSFLFRNKIKTLKEFWSHWKTR